eukprot:TRINITY_DN21937_c0_g1_i1.p1 TRINITY_DN21937_c0_g1~~TRINITY_DN21937_c0_g1_i1.p1  ORF type:complete len:126 (-),score=18.41 TRINITY_DN21937_c0_g1_i1:223-600(-)
MAGLSTLGVDGGSVEREAVALSLAGHHSSIFVPAILSLPPTWIHSGSVQIVRLWWMENNISRTCSVITGESLVDDDIEENNWSSSCQRGLLLFWQNWRNQLDKAVLQKTKTVASAGVLEFSKHFE